MKKITLYTFLLLLATTALAQGNFFNKKIKQNGNYYFNKVKNTVDDGFLFSIYTADSTFNSFSLGKIDNDGNLKWAKKVLVKDFKSDLIDATALNDANFLVAYRDRANLFSFGKNRLVKFDNTMSNVIWTLETLNPLVQIRAISELKNGNIVVAAIINISASETYTAVFTLDKNNNLLWQKTYTFPNKNNIIFEVLGINKLNDGQLLLIGNSFDVLNNQKKTTKICKIDATNGTILWQNDYESAANGNDYTFLNEDKEGNIYFKVISSTFGAFTKIETGICKTDKEGKPIWRKDYDEYNNSADIAAKPDGSFMMMFTGEVIYNYQVNINQDGKVTSSFRDIERNPLVKPTYDKNGNLAIFRTFVKCNNNFPPNELVYEKRAGNGQRLCSFTDSTTVTKDKIVKIVNLYPFSTIANYNLGFVKTTSTPFPDLNISTENQLVNCQDTTFVTRCEGETYTFNGTNLSQNGIYTIPIVPGKFPNCSDAKVVKLNILKKNITKLDTSFTCGTSINISKLNYTLAGTYQYGLYNRYGCDSFFTLNLKIINPKPASIDTLICKGKSIKIGSKEFSKTGDYKEVLKNKLGCDSIVSLQLKVSDFEFSTPDSLQITEGEQATLTATSASQNIIYEWSPPDNLSCEKCPKTIARPSQSTDYTVKGVSNDGCEAEAKVNIKVFKRGEVFVPTAFSPDDNGTNDVFTVFGNQGVAKILDYSIFDRWGNQVFNEKNFPPNDPNFGWNGTYKNKQAQQGVYIYSIKIEMTNGKVRDFSGDVMLN